MTTMSGARRWIRREVRPSNSTPDREGRSLPHPRTKAIFEIVKRAIKESSADRITASAAGLAFHWFLAIFPATVVLVALVHLLGIAPTSLKSIVHGAGVLLPNQVSSVLSEALKAPSSANTSVTELILGLAVALWSGTEAMASLQIALDVAYEVHPDRGFINRRLMSLPLLFVTVVLGGAASILLVLGDPIRTLLPRSLVAASAFDVIWFIVHWGAAIAAVTLLISIYYAIGPNRSRPDWHWLDPGSAFATIVWIVASGGFSVYLDHFGHESRTYGAFTGVAVLLLWLYLTAAALLLGAELNCERERAKPDLEAR